MKVKHSGCPGPATGAWAGAMEPAPPLSEPIPGGSSPAEQAWARYRRLMRFMMTITLLMVVAACIALYRENGLVSAHFYVATALGIGFAMLLMSALMGLVFFSNAAGHDETIADPLDQHQDDQSAG